MDFRGRPIRGSGKSETTTRSRDRTTEFLCGFDPFLDDDFDVGERFFVAFSVRGAARKLGDFSDEGFVCLAPVNDDFVFSHRLLRPSDS